MDHGAFDASTRTIAGNAYSRRAVVRVLAGGMLSGLAARFGLDESVDMGPLINEAAREKVLGYIDVGKRDTI